MALRVISKYSYNYREHLVEPDEHSETIPDQTLSIKQILARAQNGLLPPGIVQDVVYDTPETDDDFSQDSYLDNDSLASPLFDLTDLDENRERVTELKARVEADKKRKQELKDEASLSGGTENQIPDEVADPA